MANNPSYSLISAEDLRALVEAPRRFSLLDIRSDGERRNLPFFDAQPLDADLETEIAKLPKDHPLVFICYRGVRSRAAAQRFADLGFSRVFSLAGGVEAYVKQLGRPPHSPFALSA